MISSIMSVQGHELWAAPKMLSFACLGVNTGHEIVCGRKTEEKRTSIQFHSCSSMHGTLERKKTFLSLSSHIDVEDVSAMPARIQWREISCRLIQHTWNTVVSKQQDLSASSTTTECLLLGACFYNVIIKQPKPWFFIFGSGGHQGLQHCNSCESISVILKKNLL